MSYLDDLSSIFGQNAASADDVIDANATVCGESPLDIARRQLADVKTGYFEEPEGTFRACGTRFGVGYAEATAVVDPETGLAQVDINTNLHLSSKNVKAARKLCRRLNQTFIIPGLMVDDEGYLRFRPEPCNLLDGGDVSEQLGKGFSTIHAHADMVTQLEAGRAPWDVLRAATDDDDDEPEGMLAALRRMMS